MADDADDDERFPAQELHEVACAHADRLGFDLCSGDPLPEGAPEALKIHAMYHGLAADLGAECPDP